MAVPSRAALQAPQEYVVGKFAGHDIVFLSEDHLVKENLDFLVQLIPALHAAGIVNLGWEFAHASDQPLIDKLLGASAYDEELAKAIIVSWRQPSRVYAYREYEAVYRAAWTLNRSLPRGATPFRIVALNVPAVRQSWELPGSAAAQRFVSWIDINIHWAQVIQKEFVEKGAKALVYCGYGHTTTRFYNWIAPRSPDMGGSPRIITAGNIVYHNIGNRAVRLLIHGSDGDQLVMDVERLVLQSPDHRIPFGSDLAGTDLGRVPANRKGWVDGKSADFTLSDIADGYVFLAPASAWSPVTLLPDFVTPRNRWSVQASMPGYQPGEAEKTIAEINDMLRGQLERGFPGKRARTK